MRLFYFLICIALPTVFIQAQTVGTIAANVNIDDAVIYDSAGNLYGSNFVGSTVFKITPEGDVTPFVGGFQSPNGLAFDDAGNLFVVDHQGSRVYKVTPDGEKEVFAAYSRPSGIIKEPDSDTMIVTSYTSGTLGKLSPDGTLETFVDSDSLDGPVGLAYDDENRLYVANFDDRYIYRVSDTEGLIPLAQLPGEWLGFICYRDSFLYATLVNSHRIYKIDLDGNYTLFAGSSAGSLNGDISEARFNGPNGITVSPGGDSLVISDFYTKSVRYIDLSNVVSTSHLSNETIASFKVAPNPVQDIAVAKFTLKTSTKLNLDMVDMNGKVVKHLIQQEVISSGRHQIDINVEGLPSGAYFIRMTPENGLVSGRKLIVR